MKLKMKHVSLAEAKANLSRLVTAAEAGETIEITRRGGVVARLTPAARPLKPIDFDALRRLTEGMKRSSNFSTTGRTTRSACDVLRRHVRAYRATRLGYAVELLT